MIQVRILSVSISPRFQQFSTECNRYKIGRRQPLERREVLAFQIVAEKVSHIHSKKYT